MSSCFFQPLKMYYKKKQARKNTDKQKNKKKIVIK